MADFRRLGYFVQIAELGSLTRTAERLGIAQPSLSRQMRLLEQELGVTLFTRGHRGMQLTEAGEALRLRIAGPMRQIGHALYEIRSLPAETGGNVVYGMPPTAIYALAGALARRVAASAPNISLQIVDANSGHLLEWIKRGDLDGAILYGPTPTGVNATRLLEDELMLVGPPQSGLAADGMIDFRELGALPLILPSRQHGLRIALESAAAKARTKLNTHFQTDSFPLKKELVESGIGYAILPHCSFAREAEAGRLTFTRIVNPTPMRQLFVAMQSGAESPRAVLQVEDCVREEVADLVKQGKWLTGRLMGVGDS